MKEVVLVIDEVDGELGLAEVQDSRGRTYQIPLEWLPEPEDGAAYVVKPGIDASFVATPDGARQLREQSKQTLLDFHDELGEEQ